ncbi:hypothetical protein L6452_25685 [Arctium lappa]|uniref:Uncharacterized protein n=1 Tax=Arctium lappa TaxID=4217 RepID=A0ACB9ABS7_ARCLA|nr:hypothetical protein L6452_25685 [Arctium lappa]
MMSAGEKVNENEKESEREERVPESRRNRRTSTGDGTCRKLSSPTLLLMGWLVLLAFWCLIGYFGSCCGVSDRDRGAAVPVGV